MIKFETRTDVLDFVKVFGFAALETAMKRGTLKPQECMIIRWVKSIAYNKEVVIEEINDGNMIKEVYAYFESENLTGQYMTLNDQIEIVVYGQGAGKFTLREAIEGGVITREQVGNLLTTINNRNEARTILES